MEAQFDQNIRKICIFVVVFSKFSILLSTITAYIKQMKRKIWIPNMEIKFNSRKYHKDSWIIKLSRKKIIIMYGDDGYVCYDPLV